MAVEQQQKKQTANFQSLFEKFCDAFNPFLNELQDHIEADDKKNALFKVIASLEKYNLRCIAREITQQLEILCIEKERAEFDAVVDFLVNVKAITFDLKSCLKSLFFIFDKLSSFPVVEFRSGLFSDSPEMNIKNKKKYFQLIMVESATFSPIKGAPFTQVDSVAFLDGIQKEQEALSEEYSHEFEKIFSGLEKIIIQDASIVSIVEQVERFFQYIKRYTSVSYSSALLAELNDLKPVIELWQQHIYGKETVLLYFIELFERCAFSEINKGLVKDTKRRLCIILSQSSVDKNTARLVRSSSLVVSPSSKATGNLARSSSLESNLSSKNIATGEIEGSDESFNQALAKIEISSMCIYKNSLHYSSEDYKKLKVEFGNIQLNFFKLINFDSISAPITIKLEKFCRQCLDFVTKAVVGLSGSNIRDAMLSIIAEDIKLYIKKIDSLKTLTDVSQAIFCFKNWIINLGQVLLLKDPDFSVNGLNRNLQVKHRYKFQDNALATLTLSVIKDKLKTSVDTFLQEYCDEFEQLLGKLDASLAENRPEVMSDVKLQIHILLQQFNKLADKIKCLIDESVVTDFQKELKVILANYQLNSQSVVDEGLLIYLSGFCARLHKIIEKKNDDFGRAAAVSEVVHSSVSSIGCQSDSCAARFFLNFKLDRKLLPYFRLSQELTQRTYTKFFDKLSAIQQLMDDLLNDEVNECVGNMKLGANQVCELSSELIKDFNAQNLCDYQLFLHKKAVSEIKAAIGWREGVGYQPVKLEAYVLSKLRQQLLEIAVGLARVLLFRKPQSVNNIEYSKMVSHESDVDNAVMALQAIVKFSESSSKLVEEVKALTTEKVATVDKEIKEKEASLLGLTQRLQAAEQASKAVIEKEKQEFESQKIASQKELRDEQQASQAVLAAEKEKFEQRRALFERQAIEKEAALEKVSKVNEAAAVKNLADKQELLIERTKLVEFKMQQKQKGDELKEREYVVLKYEFQLQAREMDLNERHNLFLKKTLGIIEALEAVNKMSLRYQNQTQISDMCPILIDPSLQFVFLREEVISCEKVVDALVEQKDVKEFKAIINEIFYYSKEFYFVLIVFHYLARVFNKLDFAAGVPKGVSEKVIMVMEYLIGELGAEDFKNNKNISRDSVLSSLIEMIFLCSEAVLEKKYKFRLLATILTYCKGGRIGVDYIVNALVGKKHEKLNEEMAGKGLAFLEDFVCNLSNIFDDILSFANPSLKFSNVSQFQGWVVKSVFFNMNSYYLMTILFYKNNKENVFLIENLLNCIDDDFEKNGATSTLIIKTVLAFLADRMDSKSVVFKAENALLKEQRGARLRRNDFSENLNKMLEVFLKNYLKVGYCKFFEVVSRKEKTGNDIFFLLSMFENFRNFQESNSLLFRMPVDTEAVALGVESTDIKKKFTKSILGGVKKDFFLQMFGDCKHLWKDSLLLSQPRDSQLALLNINSNANISEVAQCIFEPVNEYVKGVIGAGLLSYLNNVKTFAQYFHLVQQMLVPAFMDSDRQQEVMPYVFPLVNAAVDVLRLTEVGRQHATIYLGMLLKHFKETPAKCALFVVAILHACPDVIDKKYIIAKYLRLKKIYLSDVLFHYVNACQTLKQLAGLQGNNINFLKSFFVNVEGILDKTISFDYMGSLLVMLVRELDALCDTSKYKEVFKLAISDQILRKLYREGSFDSYRKRRLLDQCPINKPEYFATEYLMYVVIKKLYPDPIVKPQSSLFDIAEADALAVSAADPVPNQQHLINWISFFEVALLNCKDKEEWVLNSLMYVMQSLAAEGKNIAPIAQAILSDDRGSKIKHIKWEAAVQQALQQAAISVSVPSSPGLRSD